MKEKLTNYSYIHYWNVKHHPKTGLCLKCGDTEKKHEWALVHGKEHARGIENYIELCQSCHRKYDHEGRNAWNKGNKAQYPKTCEYCQLSFLGAKKTSRFCNSSCAAKARPSQARTKDPITGRWLALNEKKP